MKKFYIMVANIGAGKSTYIKNKLKGATVVSKDGIRYSLGGGTYVFDYKLEPIIHSTTIHLAKRLCQAGIEEIVLDETNVEKKNRKPWIDLAKEHGYEVICVELPRIVKELSVDRRLTNPHSSPDRDLWEMVWDKFDKKYVEPSLEEGFDKIIKVDMHDVMS